MNEAPSVRNLGRVDYEPTWQAMLEFTAKRDDGTPDELWICEHPPVYTLGQAGKPEHLLAPGDIPVIQVDRGGQVTYHGPGQAVVYCLLDVRRLGLSVRALVTALEQAVIELLAINDVDRIRHIAQGTFAAGGRDLHALEFIDGGASGVGGSFGMRGRSHGQP